MAPSATTYSRRSVIGASLAALAAGVGATEGANLATTDARTAGPEPPPDVDLMTEHGILKRIILIYREVLRRMGQGQTPPAEAILESATVVHDFIESFHEVLEEVYVFPRLRQAGLLVPTIDTLLVQHAGGRQITTLLLADANSGALADPQTRQKVVAALTGFVTMFDPHEAREDTLVYPAFRSLLSPGELNGLATTFAQLEERQLGIGAFAAALGRVEAVEQELGIYDLDQFTAD